ncbi:MAG: isoprenylcysteine carboxylmethyltransferase family protein [Patescibacteria group bacterium]|nr:isoprenylcysteine carboxylmethyltransferase family protein [Patescibacteria group bacterium]
MEQHPKKIHHVLLYSYTIYFLTIVVGVIFDTFFKIKLFSGEIFQFLGVIIVILGTLIIFWAQRTSKRSKIEGKRDFHRGPYKISRHPTSIALMVITLGLGLILNSFFVIVMTIVVFFIKSIFAKREERILGQKYGEDYFEYKSKVRTWL